MSAESNSLASITLGNIEQSVLLILFLHAEESENGYTASMIRSALKKGEAGLSPTDVLFGSLYAALARLEEKRLIVSEELPPTPVQGGRKKSSFKPTEYGITVAKTMIEDLKKKAKAFGI